MRKLTWKIIVMYGSCRKLVCRFYSTMQRRSLLMSQYDKVKSQFPNHVLLFQVGDFYEIMGADAEVVALKTSLRIAKKNSMTLVGFPIKSLNEWQRTLVQAGFQLAICNQTDKKDSNCRLIDREVVQVVTPGTLIEPLDNDANYLMAIAGGSGLASLGLAWVDLSTAHFEVVSSCDINEHIERVAPAEIILSSDLNSSLSGSVHLLSTGTITRDCVVTPVSKTWFEAPPTNYNEQSLLKELHSGHYSLIEKKAVFGLLHYILHTRRKTTPLTQPPTLYGCNSHISIDANARRALEITIPQHGNSRKATLLGCIDKTVTPPGGRLLKRMLSSPLTDVDTINCRLEAVDKFYNNPMEVEWIRHKLKTNGGDLERTVQKIITGSNNALMDLASLQTTLECVREIIDYLDGHMTDHVTNSSVLNTTTMLDGLGDHRKLINELQCAIEHDDGSYCIKNGYSDDVDHVLSQLVINDGAVNKLTAQLIESTGLPKLSLVNHKAYYRVYETTKSKSTLIDESSKDTGLIRIDHTQSAVRYTHVELQKLNINRQAIEDKYSVSVNSTVKCLCDIVTHQSTDLFKTAESLAKLDIFTSFAQLAIERGFCKPVVNTSRSFHVCKGFHPVVSYLQTTDFVENDCCMDEHNLWIITGPNMGGKSTFLRQNALIIILAQIGCFVPAQSASIGVVDKLFARIGANDNVANQQSTFHMEMTETAHILNNATHNSFVILDEIGRGTSPCEGVAIAQSVLEHIHNDIGCRTLLATHFHELSSVSNSLTHAGCYHVTAVQDQHGLTFDYRVRDGHTNTSFGIGVAGLAGIPLKVIKRALEILCPPVITTPQEHATALNNSSLYNKLKKFIYK